LRDETSIKLLCFQLTLILKVVGVIRFDLHMRALITFDLKRCLFNWHWHQSALIGFYLSL